MDTVRTARSVGTTTARSRRSSLVGKTFRGVTSPAVLSLYIGDVSQSALLRTVNGGPSPVDAVVAISIVRSPHLSEKAEESSPLVAELLNGMAEHHANAVRRAYDAAQKQEHSPVQASNAPGDASLAGMSVSAMTAGGGAVMLLDQHTLVEASNAFAGLHMCDSNDDEEPAGPDIDPESIDDAWRPHSTADMTSNVVALTLQRAQSRPVYISRLRYESVSPAFDFWLRLRFSRLSPTTTIVFTVLDCRSLSVPVRLAVGRLPVGSMSAPLTALRNSAPSSEAVRGRRSSISSLLKSTASLPKPTTLLQSTASMPDAVGATSLMALVMRSSPVPLGMLRGGHYVFGWNAVPLGSRVDAKEVVLSDASDPATDAIAKDVYDHFAAPNKILLFTYDRSESLLLPKTAAASFSQLVVTKGRSTTSTALHLKPAQSVSSEADDEELPSLTLCWRMDIDDDPTAVRGALVLRSVGVVAGHPLSSLPSQYLHQLGDICKPSSEKFNDIASVLPVLEPLFRFVSGEANAIQHLTGVVAEQQTPGTAGKRPTADTSGREKDISTDEVEDELEPRGLDERIFVGVCAHCTTLSEATLRKAFRQLDANGDETLLWDEFVSYISRLLDNDLAKRAAQGTYLLIAPKDKPAASTGKQVAATEVVAGAQNSPAKPILAMSPVAVVIKSMMSQEGEVFVSGKPSADDSELATNRPKPPSKAEHLKGVEPASTVRAESEGVQYMTVLPELQGYAVCYRNNSLQILDDGFREALELEIQNEMSVLEDSRDADARKSDFDDSSTGANIRSIIPVHGIDWCGDQTCMLVVLAADRRLRSYDLSKFAAAGGSTLKDTINRRVNAEMVRLHNSYERDMQSALVSESVRYRREGLRQLEQAGKSRARLVRGVDQSKDILEDGLDRESFLLKAVLSVNITNPSAIRDEFDREEQAAGPKATPGAKMKADSAVIARGHESHLMKGKKPINTNKDGAELADIIDYGRGKDYLRVRSSMATGLALAFGAGSKTSADDKDDDADSFNTTTASSKRMLRMTFTNTGGREADPRLNALASASKGGSNEFRRVGAKVPGLQKVSATQSLQVRSLKDGLPTTVKMIPLKLYGSYEAGFESQSLGGSPASPRYRQSEPVITSTSNSMLLTAIIGDNRGFVSAHRVATAGTDSAIPTCLVKTSISSVTSIVVLPPRDTEGSASDGMVLSSSCATIVVAGLGGPITIMSVALASERKKLLLGTPAPPSFRLSIIRTLNSCTPMSHPHGVTCMAYCSTERCLVTTGVDRKVLLWNVTDAGRADAQIGQLGSPGAIASARDAIIGICANDVHSQVATITRGGRMEVYDPRTLACIQQINDDAIPIFMKGIISASLQCSLITFGSHIRVWGVREAFLNSVNAAVAVAKAVAHEQHLAALGGEPSVPAAGPKLLHTIPADADNIVVMAATSWSSICNGYIKEAKSLPFVPDKKESTEPADMGDNLKSLMQLNKIAGKLKAHAGELVAIKRDEEKLASEKAARRSSTVAEEIGVVNQLRSQLGGPLVRRGSIEAQVISGMVEELHKHGMTENASDEECDVGATDGSEPVQQLQDGRTLLRALYSTAFNQTAVVARDGLVKIYDFATGKMVMTFLADHSQRDELVGLGAAQRFFPASAAMGITPVQLTAAALDHRQRRLVTGSVFGSVRIWNLSNGMLLRNLIPVGGLPEITAVAYQPGENIIFPVIAGTNDGKLAWWKDFGRIADDTVGQGADGPSLASLSLESAAEDIAQRHQQEEEKLLLSLHVKAGTNSVSISKGSAACPAARLRHRRLVTKPKQQSVDEVDISKFLQRGNKSITSHPSSCPHRPPRPEAAAGIQVKPEVVARGITGKLDLRTINALTSPRYLSLEARGIVSMARASISSEHGIALKSKLVYLPVRPELNAVRQSTSRRPTSFAQSTMMDELCISADMAMDLAQEKAAGIIAVHGATGPAATHEAGTEERRDAVAEEAWAMFQRLAPHVVSVPEIGDEMDSNPVTAPGLDYRRKPGAASATSGKMRNMQAEVVSLVAGGGTQGDAEKCWGPRSQPWAISCSSDGAAVLWNPTTERPIAAHLLHDPELFGDHVSQAVLTCCQYINNHQLVIIGTQLGYLHVMSVDSGKCLWAGRHVGGSGSSRPDGSGRRVCLDQNADEWLRTGFFTLPISSDWSASKRGISGTVDLPAPLVLGAKRKTRRRNSENSMVSSIPLRSVGCIVSNSLGSRVLVGYEGGMLRIFDTWQLQEDAWHCFEKPLAEWKAHSAKFGVASADVVSLPSGVEFFVTCGGFDARLYTMDGIFTAQFGQSTPWPTNLSGSRGYVGVASGQQDDMIRGIDDPDDPSSPAAAQQQPLSINPLCGAFNFGWTRVTHTTSPMLPPKEISPRLLVTDVPIANPVMTAKPQPQTIAPTGESESSRSVSVLRASPLRPSISKDSKSENGRPARASDTAVPPLGIRTPLVADTEGDLRITQESLRVPDASSVQHALNVQSHKHAVRMAKKEALMGKLPSTAQNPFDYLGSGRWISRKAPE